MSRPRPLIEIFCDGNSNIGYGHIRRSITLANRLKKDGFNVRLTGLSSNATSMLPSWKNIEGKAHIAIFDSPNKIDNHLQAAKQQLTVTLDWFGQTEPDINIVIYPHKKVGAIRKQYIGFEYILVREDILEVPRVKIASQNTNVLIVIGGGDILGQGHEIANQLYENGLNVTLIQGPLAKLKSETNTYKTIHNPSNLPELLTSCDWVVSNGGNCLFEALFLGKAIHILPQTEAEMSIAQYVFNQGASLGIGFNNIKKPDIDNIATANRLGPKLVDGRGAERISNIIKELL